MPVITISRGSMSGGDQLAMELKSRLGFEVLSRESASEEAAKRYGLTSEEVVRGLVDPANLIERFTHRKERYLLAMQATVSEIFDAGNGIYHGVAGQFLFHDLCNVFKVRIIAPIDTRIEATMSDRGLSHDEAERYIGAADDHRAKWARQLFSVDILDPDLYDLVINTEHLSVAQAADKVMETLKQDKYQTNERCLGEWRDFSMVSRVQAELFFNSPFSSEEVDVTASGGVVHLSGGGAFEQSRPDVLDFVGRIRGVTRVITDHDIRVATGITERDRGSLELRAKDVMQAADRYPRVSVRATIGDAITAVGGGAGKHETGYCVLPRYVLVHDGDDNLIGIVSRHQMLKGLVPHLRQDEESVAHIQDLMPFGGEPPSELFIRWASLFSDTALELAEEPVSAIMSEIEVAVSEEDNLSTVISTMLHHSVDLVPVLDHNKKLAGLVLMANVFEIVGRFIQNHGTPSNEPSGTRPNNG